MLFNSEGELEGIVVTLGAGWAGGGIVAAVVPVAPVSADAGDIGFWVGVGDTEIGLVGGEFEAARG